MGGGGVSTTLKYWNITYHLEWRIKDTLLILPPSLEGIEKDLVLRRLDELQTPDTNFHFPT